MSRSLIDDQRLEIVWDALAELQDEDADIIARWAAAQELRRTFGLPVDHHPECAVRQDPKAECNCHYWGAAPYGQVHILLN